MLRLPVWEVKPAAVRSMCDEWEGEIRKRLAMGGDGIQWMLVFQSHSPCAYFSAGAKIRSREVEIQAEVEFGRKRLTHQDSDLDLSLSLNLLFSLTMPNITLLVSPSCGACPSAKSLWKQLKVKYSFSYREVDITTKDGQELADRHSVRAVPATIIDGRLTFVGVPSRESAEKAIQLKIKQREEG